MCANCLFYRENNSDCLGFGNLSNEIHIETPQFSFEGTLRNAALQSTPDAWLPYI